MGSKKVDYIETEERNGYQWQGGGVNREMLVRGYKVAFIKDA